ncbi:hypothetical protein A6A06_29405 [Streptomyces sp. CB02923]|uniref:DUF488 domain-containing protein n=1 Tax=Streptomyces sp. CB02923 TaxID=1718985 RepID=UPI00093D0005|nr:DUF488 family protein [Streptomyces sp. CB02923]OKH98308.1 hypothetical protein A6A06_29405 [Streptomyces sp. CB02923]
MGDRRGEVRQRRVYEAPEGEDGARVLVDRLWPRGVAKDAARLDEWCKDVAPSKELRTWYGHRAERYEEFAERYRAELAVPPAAEALDGLRERVAAGPVTLLTATKEIELSHVTVLAEVLGE